jgi:hypothetical protein
MLKVVMKVHENVLNVLRDDLRDVAERNANPSSFMAGRITINPVFMLLQAQEEILQSNQKRSWTFDDLEKAFGRVPREVVNCMEPKEDLSRKSSRE